MGIEFTVQRSLDLLTWSDLATVPGSDGVTSYLDPAPPAGVAFYRWGSGCGVSLSSGEQQGEHWFWYCEAVLDGCLVEQAVGDAVARNAILPEGHGGLVERRTVEPTVLVVDGAGGGALDLLNL